MEKRIFVFVAMLFPMLLQTASLQAYGDPPAANESFLQIVGNYSADGNFSNSGLVISTKKSKAEEMYESLANFFHNEKTGLAEVVYPQEAFSNAFFGELKEIIALYNGFKMEMGVRNGENVVIFNKQ